MNSSGQVGFYAAGADRIAPSSSSVVVGGTWNHIALARSSSVTNMWINGSLAGSVSDSRDYANTNNYKIGGPAGSISAYHVQGYISNYRFIKGTALYSGSGSITVPTSYLTAVTNTKLLCCQSNRYKDNSTVGSALSVVYDGSYNAIKPFAPFAPSAEYDTSTMGGSGHFNDTTGESISFSDSSLAIGTSDFTIEGWFYFDGATSSGVGLFQQGDGLNGPALAWWPGGSNGWQFYYGSGTWTHATGATARMFEWTHIAFVRSSNVSNLYVNGVKATSDVSDSYNYTSTVFEIGQFYGTGYEMEGYISNFKMCLNASYTSNFTPPTALVTPTSGGSSAASTKILVDFTNAAIIDSSQKTNVQTVNNAQLDTSIKKFGTASVELDGTSDYLEATPVISPDRGSWTYECFIYPKTVVDAGGYGCIFSTQTNAPNTDGVALYYISNTKKLECFGPAAGGTYISTANDSITLDQWQHVALVFDLNATNYPITLYVNGTSVGSSTTNTWQTRDSGLLKIGAQHDGGLEFTGFIDEFRVSLKARYQSNFSPPSKAFSNL